MTLHCQGLSKRFGAVQALHDVTIEFPDQGCVGIIGPNGAGKTTLSNIISGFVQPDTGRCFYRGLVITGLAPHQITRKGISRSFQDLRLIFDVPAIDNVLLAFQQKEDESIFSAIIRTGVSAQQDRHMEDANRLLQLIGLEAKAKEPAREYSYGQQKLLSLACCVATGAQVLLLDEPVSGVAPTLAFKILDFLVELKNQRKLLVIIEHDLEVVRRIADTVIVLDRGKVIAHGETMEVLARPDILDAYVR